MPEEIIVPKKFEVPVENLKSNKVANRLFLQTVADALGVTVADVGLTTVHPEGDFSKVLALRVTIPGDKPIQPALDAVKALEVPDEETDAAKVAAEQERLDDISQEKLLQFVKNARQKLQQLEARVEALENA